ncbi:hypothetical protein BsWGS_01064 [Bradybaena similaris]
MESVFLTALIALSAVVQAQPNLSVKFLESNVEVAVQERQRITCELNRTLLDLVNNIDVEIVRQSVDNATEKILSRGARKVAAEPPDYYSVMISENPGIGIKIKFEFLKVRVQDEGRYLCRVKPNDDDTVVLGQDSINVVVLKPVENVYLKFGNYDPISSSQTDPVEVDAGNYPVVCTAEGSNPAATVHLHVDGKPVHKQTTQTNKTDSHLIQFRTVVTGEVLFTFSNSRGTVECVVQHQLGNKSLTFPFKTKVYEPEIYCNDTEAYPGQRHPVLTCTVDYKGLNIKSFRYEATGTKKAVFQEVSKEHLSNTTVRVHLKLETAQDWHFETEFYMVVEHQDGHLTRQSVRLHKIPDSGGHSLIHSGPALIALFAYFMWLL